MQVTPIPKSHVQWWIKMSWTISEKSRHRNISVKLFQNLASCFREKDFLEFSWVRLVQVAPIHQSPFSLKPCLLTYQNFTNFDKVHPRNISVKLLENLTSNFREEDFLRISSCPYSASSHHSAEPCLLTDQNFLNDFWKGSPNIPVKLFQNPTSSFREDFSKIS